MDKAQKNTTYSAALATLRSKISKATGEVYIYMIVVDTLASIPHYTWIGIYFYNPITKEFYLGYYNGKKTNTNVVQLKQFKFDKFEITNDINSEQKQPISPDSYSEFKIFMTKNDEILGLLVVGSERNNFFDEIDKKYLFEIAETVAERIHYI